MLPCSTLGPVSTATQATPLPWSPAMNVARVSLFPFYFIMVGRSGGGGREVCRAALHLGLPLLPCTRVLAARHSVFRPEPDFYTQRHPSTALWPLTD